MRLLPIVLSTVAASALLISACGSPAQNEAAKAEMVATESAALNDWFEARFEDELECDARMQTPADLSCRGWSGRKVQWIAAAFLTSLLVLAVLWPLGALTAVFGWALIANLVTALFRLTVLTARFWPERTTAPALSPGVEKLADHRSLPVVSLMIPLHREDRVLPALLKHLGQLDYPRECLDIKLLIEEHDNFTLDALDKLELVAHVEVVRVPDNTLKTKPRALNYGLNFCKGDIVGILDAEDRPHRDQINAVIRNLHEAPPDVACVQGMLDFYNPRHNWLSRCFTVEYAIWFNVLLRGMRRLNLPVPLGGTSVYFRRPVLESLCGWDAHNVTEDADLGMRIARYGYRTEILPSTTMEEANSAFVPWIKQRSRWLKGYLITWAVHMRNPVTLFQDLGLFGFLTFQIIFLGGVTAYLSIPLFWMMWIGILGFDLGTFLGGGLFWPIALSSLFLGQFVMLAVAVTACARPGKWWLLAWLPTLFLYWPIGALATFKAIGELVTDPFYWDKTSHGDFT